MRIIQDDELFRKNIVFKLNDIIKNDLEDVKKMGIDPDIYNVNGGSISIGHPFGMTGSRLTGHIIRELKRRNKRFGIVSMCIGGGMGAAGLIESC